MAQQPTAAKPIFGHVLSDEADFVLEPLQLQSMRRLCGAPFVAGAPVSVEEVSVQVPSVCVAALFLVSC